MAYSVSALEAFNLPMNIKNRSPLRGFKESRFPAPVCDGRRLRSTVSRSPLRGHVALLLCVSLAILVAGCGQRGPLYLPDEGQSGQEQTEQEAPEKEPEESDEENS